MTTATAKTMPPEGTVTMVEGKNLDTAAVVTAMIDSMVQALADQMHAEDNERLRAEIAFCEASPKPMARRRVCSGRY
jgi:hypothetical protein